MVGLALTANEFVQVVLGSRWSGAVPVLRILAPVAIAQSLISLTGTTLLGIGRPTWVFRLSLANTIFVVSAFAIGLNWGVVGVAVGFAAVTFPLAGVSMYVTSIALRSGFRNVVRAVFGPLEATAVMAVAVFGAQMLLERYSVQAWIELVLLICVGVIVYTPACLLRVAAVRAELGRFRRLSPAIRIAEAIPLATAGD
jgi:PST family polysaccharide transporter